MAKQAKHEGPAREEKSNGDLALEMLATLLAVVSIDVGKGTGEKRPIDPARIPATIIRFALEFGFQRLAQNSHASLKIADLEGDALTAQRKAVLTEVDAYIARCYEGVMALARGRETDHMLREVRVLVHTWAGKLGVDTKGVRTLKMAECETFANRHFQKHGGWKALSKRATANLAARSDALPEIEID